MIQIKPLTKIRTTGTIVLTLLVFISYSIFSALQKNTQEVKETRVFENGINYIDKQLEIALENEAHNAVNILTFNYLNDSLTKWNNNLLNPNKLNKKEDGLIKINNNWYLKKSKTIGQQKKIVLATVKKNYANENSLLKSHFHPALRLNKNTRILATSQVAENTVAIANKRYKIVSYPNSNEAYHAYFFYTECIALLLLLLILILLIKNVSDGSSLLGYASIVIGLRLILYHPLFLAQIKLSDWFNPKVYAWNSVFKSLGDTALHIIFTAILIYCAYRAWQIGKKQIKTLVNILCLAWLAFSIYLIPSMIAHGKLALNLDEIINISFYAWFILLLLIANIAFTQLLYLRLNQESSFKTTLFNLIFLWLLLLWIPFNSVLIVPFIVLGFLPFFPYLFKSFNLAKIQSLAIVILCTTLYITFPIQQSNKVAQEQQIKDVLVKKAEERNPIVEYLIMDQIKEISKHLKNQVSDLEVIEDKILELPGDFKFKYHFCKSKKDLDCINDPTFNTTVDINEFYTLYYNIAYGKEYYTALIPYPNKTLVINLLPKKINYEYGLPMILANKQIEAHKFDFNQSFAKYQNNNLISTKGNFNFPYVSHANWWNIPKQKIKIIQHPAHHLYLYKHNNKLYVLAVQTKSISSLIAPYSYVIILSLIIFSLLYSLKFLNAQKSKQSSKLWKWIREIFMVKILNNSFKWKIQFSILLMLIISSAIILSVSLHVQKTQHMKNIHQNISDKMEALSKNIQSKFAHQKSLNSFNKSYLQNIVSDVSANFATEVSLYNHEGKLSASSSNRIYEKGILSKLIHPKALELIVDQKQKSCIQMENIDQNLSYLAAYRGIFNDEQALMGIIQLPYLTDIGLINKEINDVILTLVNIYVVLILVSLLIGLFIAQKITQPLVIIRENMKAINISGNNKKINWETSDEIGALITQYNQMLEQLEYSAQKLAKQERESAWRTMAQQVAHEIKNPLTPMKLSLQYLEMQWNQLNEAERKQRFHQMSAQLIEQIEVLANIATAFSSFAKMPQGKKEAVELNKIIKNTVALFENQHEFKLICEGEIKVWANKEQVIRVLSNLIKNAIQALPDGHKGLIVLESVEEKTHALITVTDNGSGIPEEIKDKIFTPNFTTKNSGMGLGLAMCKQIIEQHNGEISFSSSNEGTQFCVKLPLVEAQED